MLQATVYFQTFYFFFSFVIFCSPCSKLASKYNAVPDASKPKFKKSPAKHCVWLWEKRSGQKYSNLCPARLHALCFCERLCTPAYIQQRDPDCCTFKKQQQEKREQQSLRETQMKREYKKKGSWVKSLLRLSLLTTPAPVSYWLIIASQLFSKLLSNFFFWCLSVFIHSAICCCVAQWAARHC